MTYCAFEQADFPDNEFERDPRGVLWHKVAPRHTTLGEIEEPGTIPGLEEAEEEDESGRADLAGPR